MHPRVIATTSSPTKAEALKQLGAQYVINYKTEPTWGALAKSLSFNGEGVDHIIEVGGQVTMAQSLQAVKIDGVISLINVVGVVGGAGGGGEGIMDILVRHSTVKGIVVGSRLHFEAMVCA